MGIYLDQYRLGFTLGDTIAELRRKGAFIDTPPHSEHRARINGSDFFLCILFTVGTHTRCAVMYDARELARFARESATWPRIWVPADYIREHGIKLGEDAA